MNSPENSNSNKATPEQKQKDSHARQWVRINETAMQSGDWTIAKYQVEGKWIHKLWDGEKMVGKFESFAEADAAIDEERKSHRAPAALSPEAPVDCRVGRQNVSSE